MNYFLMSKVKKVEIIIFIFILISNFENNLESKRNKYLKFFYFFSFCNKFQNLNFLF